MLSQQVKNYIPKIKAYLSTQPVLRAWIFGSCSRGEENHNSDIDILVDYDRSQPITLFTMGGIMSDLQEILGRNVDLIENGCLMPFAQPSANKDKILIYERRN